MKDIKNKKNDIKLLIKKSLGGIVVRSGMLYYFRIRESCGSGLINLIAFHI